MRDINRCQKLQNGDWDEGLLFALISNEKIRFYEPFQVSQLQISVSNYFSIFTLQSKV